LQNSSAMLYRCIKETVKLKNVIGH